MKRNDAHGEKTAYAAPDVKWTALRFDGGLCASSQENENNTEPFLWDDDETRI